MSVSADICCYNHGPIYIYIYIYHDDDDGFYTALFSALEQTLCARMRYIGPWLQHFGATGVPWTGGSAVCSWHLCSPGCAGWGPRWPRSTGSTSRWRTRSARSRSRYACAWRRRARSETAGRCRCWSEPRSRARRPCDATDKHCSSTSGVGGGVTPRTLRKTLAQSIQCRANRASESITGAILRLSQNIKIHCRRLYKERIKC